jgi:peroxiredoxin Q/BCP
MIEEGQPFPNFSLKDQDENTVTLESLKGSPTVVYFYPKADTKGCTVEACEFRDQLPPQGDVKVVGVSPDSPKKQKKFAEKFDLNFPLLADEETELAQACGVWVEKSMYGKTYMGVERSTFLLDADGNVQKAWRKVKPAGHAEAVLSQAKA